MTAATINLFDQLTPALQRAIEAVGDLSEPMKEISANWLTDVKTRFNQGVDTQGVPWKPRSDGSTDALLFKSGDLADAIKPNAGEDFAEVGVRDTGGPSEYAAIHNYGGVVRPKEKKALRTPFGAFAQIVIPKREYLGASEDDQAMAVRVLSEHLQQAFNADAGGLS